MTTEDNPYEFGGTLRGWREAAKLSQVQFAATLGVSQQTVSDWERGRNLPDWRRAEGMDKLLGLERGTVLAALTAELRHTEDLQSGVQILQAPHHGSVNDRLAALEAAVERQEAALHEVLGELRSLRGAR